MSPITISISAYSIENKRIMNDTFIFASNRKKTILVTQSNNKTKKKKSKKRVSKKNKMEIK